MKHFTFSIFFSTICLFLAFWWGGFPAMFTAIILGILEVSLSFDNAVVNASVIRDWNNFWRQIFLTLGIFIAVFGMRLYFPLEIVSTVTGMGLGAVAQLAIHDPERYAAILIQNNASISAFGGAFLLLVFLNFFFNSQKEHVWLTIIETNMAKCGKIDSISVLIALVVVVLSASGLLAGHEQAQAIKSGVWGIILYLLVRRLGDLFDGTGGGKVVSHGNIMGFLYLELLDASFSLDGVIGAFAITRDVVVIMLGLGIGAVFVRSFTIFLVERDTLKHYIFLEHGAHYAIGALAIIMFIGMKYHISEIITGLIGLGFIAASLFSSISHQRCMNAAGSLIIRAARAEGDHSSPTNAG